MSQMTKREEYYHELIDSVNVFTAEVDLPNHIQSRCREYIKHKHRANTLESVDSTLMQLSKSLREEVAMHTHSGWVQSVDFFKGCPSGFVVTMASVMKIHTFTSKEAVYSAGDNATKLFVVNKGVVAK